MNNIKKQFRIFEGNANSDFKINVSADYPSSIESLDLLKQKYPEISNQLTMIYNSFEKFNRNDYIFFEGTIEEDGVKLPFVNYVSMNKCVDGPMDRKIECGRNFILIPNRGTELYNLGDYNGNIINASHTYEQDFAEIPKEYFDNHILLEERNNKIIKMSFYSKNELDHYYFQISNGNLNSQNGYLNSYYRLFGIDNQNLEIKGGRTIDCGVHNFEKNEEHKYNMLFDSDLSLLRLYFLDMKDDNLEVTLYHLVERMGYIKYIINLKNYSSSNSLSNEFMIKEDGIVLSSDELEHIVEERLPNVAAFSKTIKPLIDNYNQYDIPNVIAAISKECVNYTKEHLNGVVLS